jgi:hypothetical protein
MTDYARYMAQQASERREAEIIAGLEAEIERLRDERDRLLMALSEARPYVFNRTQGTDWRAETAQQILARVDATLAAARRTTERIDP